MSSVLHRYFRTLYDHDDDGNDDGNDAIIDGENIYNVGVYICLSDRKKWPLQTKTL